MSHPVHIHCASTVTLPAHPFTAVGTQSGTVHRAFLTNRPGAVRMAIPVIVQARRNLQSSYTQTVLARRRLQAAFDAGITPASLVRDASSDLSIRNLGAVASIALMVLMCIIGAACSGMLHL